MQTDFSRSVNHNSFYQLTKSHMCSGSVVAPVHGHELSNKQHKPTGDQQQLLTYNSICLIITRSKKLRTVTQTQAEQCNRGH